MEIKLGFGLVEVAEGSYNNKYALLFGNKGNGIIGDLISANRKTRPEEILSVVTFENIASIDVLIDQLNKLKYRMENKLPVDIKNEFGDIIQTIKPELN